MVHNRFGLRHGQRFKVREEGAGRCNVSFRLGVEAGAYGVVRTLEQVSFAVRDQLGAAVGILRIEVLQGVAGHYDRGRDIVLYLHLFGGMEVRPQLVNAPGTLRIEAHPQIVADQLLVIVLQLMAEKAVDAIDSEMPTPVIAPFRPVVPLDGEDKLADGLR